MRESLVAIGFTVLVLVPFFLFVGLGWPDSADIDGCVTDTADGDRANSCYCEPFDETEIRKAGVVHQPFNTFSNFYVFITVPFLIWRMAKTRNWPSAETSKNLMVSTNRFPLLYLCIVIFLGLGSMWLHAFLVSIGGSFDNLSMYTFSNFLVFFTLLKITKNEWIFWIFYPLSTVLFVVAGIDSFAVILVSVTVYAAMQWYIWSDASGLSNNDAAKWYYWLPAGISIAIAIVLWALSQTGGPLCFKTHWFQFHGVWHLLAGVTALLLYFFWRDDPV